MKNPLSLYLLHCLLISFFSLSANGQTFKQSQSEAGIDHVFQHAQFNGGGAAFSDIDNDGDDDLYINGGKGMDLLYINNGDGTFSDITVGSGLEITADYYTTGVISGDIDNDGSIDFFVGTYGSNTEAYAKNLLFLNNGDLTFTEIWDQTQSKDLAFAMGSTFLDFDLDGYLDIYVVNYVENIRFTYDDNNQIDGFDHDCFRNTFYRNKGDGSFEEISYHLGLNDTGCALAVTSTDFNMDHLMDIYIANDFGAFITPNQLYQNNLNEDGRFINVSEEQKADYELFGMGIAIGDIDNDLDPDYYISNMGRNVLARNDLGIFTDITTESGVENMWEEVDVKPTIGWGTAFLDADNDSDLDLYIGNGYVPGPGFIQTSVFNHDLLYINDGNGYFESKASTGIENAFSTRGVAYSDYDLDGDIDILAVVHDGPSLGFSPKCVLFENTTNNENNWVKIKLEGVVTHKDAYGSKVYLYSGNEVFFQETNGGSSHNSHNSSWLHFGLGSLNYIDSIHVIWTGDVSRQTILNPSINSSHYIMQDISDIVAIEDVDSESKIGIHPNPALDVLRVETSGQKWTTLDIYSVNGQLVKRVKFGDTGNLNIEVADLEKGLYILEIKADKERFYRKFIKS